MISGVLLNYNHHGNLCLTTPFFVFFSLFSSHHPLLRRCRPPRLCPPPLWPHHLLSDWKDVLSQAQPIKGLPITHRGHRGVSKFILPIVGVALLGIMTVKSAFGGDRFYIWIANPMEVEQEPRCKLKIWLKEGQTSRKNVP